MESSDLHPDDENLYTTASIDDILEVSPVNTFEADASSATNDNTAANPPPPVMPMLGRLPANHTCQFCQHTGPTRVKEKFGICAIIALVVLLVCFWQFALSNRLQAHCQRQHDCDRDQPCRHNMRCRWRKSIFVTLFLFQGTLVRGS